MIGERLPEELREYLLTVDSKDEIWLELYDNVDGGEHIIRTIYGLEEGVSDYSDIERALIRSRNCLPENTILVAHSIGGYIFMFLESTGKEGCYFLDHESEATSENIDQITTSFADFVDSLGPTEN